LQNEGVVVSLVNEDVACVEEPRKASSSVIVKRRGSGLMSEATATAAMMKSAASNPNFYLRATLELTYHTRIHLPCNHHMKL